MLDLETLSNADNGLIIAIGALEFDIEERWLLMRRPMKTGDFFDVEVMGDRLYGTRAFFKTFNPNEKVDFKHYDIQPSVVKFWLEQPATVQKLLWSGNTRRRDMAGLFCAWFDTEAKIWGNGSVYDVTKIGNLIRTEMPDATWRDGVPWYFRNVRDCRTEQDHLPEFLDSEPTPFDMFNHLEEAQHHPLFDCYRSICLVQESYANIRHLREVHQHG